MAAFCDRSLAVRMTWRLPVKCWEGAAIVAGSGLGRGVLAGGLGRVGLLLRCVGGLCRVLRWRVDRVEHERLVAGVAEVVLRAGRYGALVAGLDGVGLAGQVGASVTAHEVEDLIRRLVGLVADLAARRDGHGDDLGVVSGPQDAAEIRVLLSDLGDGEVLDVVSDGVLLSHDGLPLDSMVLMSSTLRITPPGDHDGRNPRTLPLPAEWWVGGGRRQAVATMTTLPALWSVSTADMASVARSRG